MWFHLYDKFYRELFSGVLEVNKLEEYKKTPKNLPIHIFSATHPVGDMGKGVKKYMKTIKMWCERRDTTFI